MVLGNEHDAAVLAFLVWFQTESIRQAAESSWFTLCEALAFVSSRRKEHWYLIEQILDCEYCSGRLSAAAILQ